MALPIHPWLLKAAAALDKVDALFVRQEKTKPTSSAWREGATVAGRYRLDALLGEGGMGRVWLAQDLLEKRVVALKELRRKVHAEGKPFPSHASLADDEEDIAFKREFFNMTKLQHPNTVQVLDSGRADSGERYIAMEVVQGQDLDKLLQKGPLQPKQTFRILADLAQVLGFLHARLFVHCDIKAENLRLTDKGQLKLMDFGLMHQLGVQEALAHFARARKLSASSRERAAADLHAAETLFSKLQCQGWLQQIQDFRLKASGTISASTFRVPL